jgi:hypothetical protein
MSLSAHVAVAGFVHGQCEVVGWAQPTRYGAGSTLTFGNGTGGGLRPPYPSANILTVIPAKTGVLMYGWTPAFAGMTNDD